MIWILALCLWRGETTTVSVADNIEVGAAPAGSGITCRVGVPQGVSYFASGRRDVRTALDRLDFAAKGGCRYVELAAARDAKPGTHWLGNLEVKVVDRELPPPKEWKTYLDLWQHPWAVARYFNVKPFSKEHYAKMRPLWLRLADAGQKALTTTLLDEPWNHQCFDAYHPMIGRKEVKGKGVGVGEGVGVGVGVGERWQFDYSVFDEYVEFGRSCGIGPHIACYTMCPWGYRVSYEDADGKMVKREAKPGSDFFREYWEPFLVDFARHLKAKGWFDDTYIAMDERSPEDVREICTLVRRVAPGLKVSMAGNRRPSDFRGIEIDNYCQYLGKIDANENESFAAEIAKRRSEGKITTFYVCCDPARPNTFVMSPADEAFWLGAYAPLGGFDGFLRWAYNSWPYDPMRDSSFGHWAPGDTYLVYPDGSPSVRFAELRNGIVAGEKLRILMAEGEVDAATLARLRKVYDREKALGKYDFRAARETLERVVNRQTAVR